MESTRDLTHEIGNPDDDVHAQKMLLEGAERWGSKLQGPTTPDTRHFFLASFIKVQLRDGEVEIRLQRARLRRVLFAKEGTCPVPDHAERNAQPDERDLLHLTVKAQLKRCGREMRLILPRSPDPGAVARFDAALVKAVARGFIWHERLTAGDVVSVEGLAKELGLAKRYVNRVIRCALLAPDIVELILDGRQPPELTLNRLFQGVPPDWAEQRRLFGVSGK